MARNRGGWSRKALDYLEGVKQVIEEIADYWPLTLRQIYYRMTGVELIPKTTAAYRKLSRILTKARLDGLVPWEAMEDRAREALWAGGWPDKDDFIEEQYSHFLCGYRRDLLQSQDRLAVECWVEKDALSRLLHEVAARYCVPVFVARGFSSVTCIHECHTRILENVEEGKQTVLLYFGDLDPSGWEMLPAMLETLQFEMGLGNDVEGVRCALTLEQVDEFKLPDSIDAIKDGDPRAPRYREMLAANGRRADLAVELDALHPRDFQRVAREAIEKHLDMEAFESEREVERHERGELNALRDKIVKLLEGEDQP